MSFLYWISSPYTSGRSKCKNLVRAGIIAFLGNIRYSPGGDILKRSARYPRSSTTVFMRGIPFFIRSVSIVLSGSPGTKTCLKSLSGLAFLNRLSHWSISFLNSSDFRNASIRMAPKKCPIPFPGIFSGMGIKAGKGGTHGSIIGTT